MRASRTLDEVRVLGLGYLIIVLADFLLVEGRSIILTTNEPPINLSRFPLVRDNASAFSSLVTSGEGRELVKLLLLKNRNTFQTLSRLCA